MTREEIEQGFISAGWEIADPYWRYPLVGDSGKLSIVAHKSYTKTDDPVFELVDGRRVLSYWVRAIPTLRQAAVLLEEHGGRPSKSEATPTNRTNRAGCFGRKE